MITEADENIGTQRREWQKRWCGEAGGGGGNWAVLKEKEESFQNSRKGRTLQAQGRVCAKPQKWELIENIYGISTSAQNLKIGI